MEEIVNNKLTFESYIEYYNKKKEFKRLEKERLKSDYKDLPIYYPDLKTFAKQNNQHDHDGQYLIFIYDYSNPIGGVQDLFLRTNSGKDFILFWKNCIEFDSLNRICFYDCPVLEVYDLKNNKIIYMS